MSNLRQKFIQYHKDNPKIWKLFIRYTHQAIRAGHNHYSADAIFHRIRWHATVETQGDSFKLNNNYVSRYARMYHKKFPEFDGFFRTRVLKTRTSKKIVP